MNNKNTFAKRFLLWQIPLLLFCVDYALAFAYAQRIGSPLFSCRFAALLHFYCPGCGGSRAAFALLRGRIFEAFRFYAPLPITAALLLLSDVRLLLFLKSKGGFPSRRFGYACLAICVGSVILQLILRNVLLLFGIDYLGDILG